MPFSKSSHTGEHHQPHSHNHNFPIPIQIPIRINNTWRLLGITGYWLSLVEPQPSTISWKIHIFCNSVINKCLTLTLFIVIAIVIVLLLFSCSLSLSFVVLAVISGPWTIGWTKSRDLFNSFVVVIISKCFKQSKHFLRGYCYFVLLL